MLVLGGGLIGSSVVIAACSDGGSSASSASSPSTASTASTTVAGASSSTAVGAPSAAGTPPTTVFTAADFEPLDVCRVLPELMAGPFPTKVQMERRDITEGRAGEPLRVGIRVVDRTCTPIPGAAVEIWHCDVDGDYSSYLDGVTPDDDGETTTFLRGTQTTNADGIVEFVTIWPGWYPGRAIHIHSRVHVEDDTVLTTQYLFDDDLNTEVMATGPYAPHGPPDTPNADDSVAEDPAAQGLLFSVADDPALKGRRALIVVGVDPAAESA